MVTLYNEMLVAKLERAIRELSEDERPQSAAERQKMVAFFQSIIAECREDTSRYEARTFAELERGYEPGYA